MLMPLRSLFAFDSVNGPRSSMTVRVESSVSWT
jgi:hypothetical protein